MEVIDLPKMKRKEPIILQKATVLLHLFEGGTVLAENNIDILGKR